MKPFPLGDFTLRDLHLLHQWGVYWYLRGWGGSSTVGWVPSAVCACGVTAHSSAEITLVCVCVGVQHTRLREAPRMWGKHPRLWGLPSVFPLIEVLRSPNSQEAVPSNHGYTTNNL